MSDDSRIKSLSEYQKTLSVFENTNDFSILPGLFLIVRLDAHRVSNKSSKEYPFNEGFFNVLLETAKSLLQGPIFSVCSYVHGDEISLLISIQESSNPRKRSKLLSILSSYATLLANQRLPENEKIIFHSKLSEIPDVQTIADYFIWQRFVAVRNSVNYFLINSASKDKAQSKELVSTVGSLGLIDRTKYLEDLGIEYWKKKDFIHSGEFIYREELDENSRKVNFNSFANFNGIDGLNVQEYLDDFLEVLYSSLQVSGSVLSDEELLKLGKTQSKGRAAKEKPAINNPKEPKEKISKKPKSKAVSQKPAENSKNEKDDATKDAPKKVPFRIGSRNKSANFKGNKKTNN